MRQLSSGQERIWLLQQVETTSTAYNVRLAVGFAEIPHRTTLVRALDALVARHAILRSVFRAGEDGTPRVSEDVTFSIPLAWKRVSHGQDWRTEAAPLAELPFDLAAAPPVRGMVVARSDGSAVLCLVFHHIVVDGRSLQILVRDLSRLYTAALTGEPANLPELPADYQDFADRQRAAAPEKITRQLAYWREELSGVTPLEFPLDRATRWKTATSSWSIPHRWPG